MTKRCPDLFARANLDTIQMDSGSIQVDGRFDTLRKMFRTLWPTKTAVNLALYADVTVGQADKLLGGKQGFSGAVITRMLQGEHGLQVLRALMGTAAPQWWQEFDLERSITQARKDEIAAQRRRRELEARVS